MRFPACVALLLSIPALAVAGQSKAPPPATYRMQVVYIFETQTADSVPESIMVIGSSGFRSLKALRAFVENLPKGTVLDWDPGCMHLGGELLLSSEKDMAEFKALCDSRGITLIIHLSG